MNPPDPADLWVFAYGSLIWRPGFAFLERVEARLIGAHRALCVYSFYHRGTAERPGLVLGLDHGGACRGIAYRVAAAGREETIRYLREREQVTTVYRERIRRVWLKGELEQKLHHVRQGHGHSGANRDYVISTVAALEALGLREGELHLLAERLKGTHEITAASTAS